jgi:hypothetical protein
LPAKALKLYSRISADTFLKEGFQKPPTLIKIKATRDFPLGATSKSKIIIFAGLSRDSFLIRAGRPWERKAD